MASLARAFSYLIAMQMQALGLILCAWWGGNWLNENHPTQINWYAVTFPLAIIGIGQTFYVVIKHAFEIDKKTDETMPGDQSKADQTKKP